MRPYFAENRSQPESKRGPKHQGRFYVEKILSRRLRHPVDGRVPRNDDFVYLIKWDGFPPEENTWEPLENLDDCPQIPKKFLDETTDQL